MFKTLSPFPSNLEAFLDWFGAFLGGALKLSVQFGIYWGSYLIWRSLVVQVRYLQGIFGDRWKIQWIKYEWFLIIYRRILESLFSLNPREFV
jgi:hypothetical protein